MIKKKCTQCGQEKELTDFHKRKDSKDGHRNECKDCHKKRLKKYYVENRYRILNKCKDNNKKYYVANKYKILKRSKKWRDSNKEYRKIKRKEYNESHKEERNQYRRNRRKEDLVFKLKMNLRSLFGISFQKRGFTKKSKTYQILGCSFEEFKNYLFENAKLRYPDFKEEDFLEKGKYHIDHIIPLATANSEEEIIKLNHYTNLQLLTAEDNLKKSNKLSIKT